MSEQNEHYLERIRFLEQELEQTKCNLDICRNNLVFREHQLSLVTQHHYFFTKQLPVTDTLAINKLWGESDEFKVISGSNPFCAPLCDDVIMSEGDCINVNNHERDELYREDEL